LQRIQRVSERRMQGVEMGVFRPHTTVDIVFFLKAQDALLKMHSLMRDSLLTLNLQGGRNHWYHHCSAIN
jgi:hypothetical protein